MVSCCLPQWEDAVADLTIDECVKQMEPGDLVLFQGRGLDAWFIRWASPGGKWSHVGVCIEVNGQKCITEAYDTVIQNVSRTTGQLEPAIDPITGTSHTGIQTTDAWGRLMGYPSHHLAFRKLARVDGRRIDRQEINRRILVHLDNMKKRTGGKMAQYNLRPTKRYNIFRVLSDWYEYGTRGDDDDDGGRYVCTHWAQECLQKALICKDRVGGEMINPGNALLDDFGQAWRQPPYILSFYSYGAVCQLEPPEGPMVPTERKRPSQPPQFSMEPDVKARFPRVSPGKFEPSHGPQVSPGKFEW